MAHSSSAAGPPGDGQHPTVSVVSVNYNGRRYLEAFLQSVFELNYPAPCYEVVLVDNASADDSVELVRARFPRVRIVHAGRNLGFAGGCNLGIRATRSDYVALVNNDTVVEPDWLRELVAVAESDSRIGMVGSKILFLTPFLDLGLEVMAPRGLPGEAVLILHEARVVGCDYDKLIVRTGHLGTMGDGDPPCRLLASSARLAVPVAHAKSLAIVMLRLAAPVAAGDVTVRVSAGDTLIDCITVTPMPKSIRVEVPPGILGRGVGSVINNAGSRIDREGRFGDRGIFEFDHGQYDAVMDVSALCGASVLLRRRMLEDIGGFDVRYFMYFEDTDLCWRAGRAGWRLVYTPHSRLRHVHSGTTREGSPRWRFFVTRNRLFWLIKHGTARAMFLALAQLSTRTMRGAFRRLIQRLHRPREPLDPAVAIDLQVAGSVARHLPGLLISRVRQTSSHA